MTNPRGNRHGNRSTTESLFPQLVIHIDAFRGNERTGWPEVKEKKMYKYIFRYMYIRSEAELKEKTNKNGIKQQKGT
jgi:hypothetical protein